MFQESAAGSSAAADEPRVLCIIRDMTDSETQTKFTLNLPQSYTGKHLLEAVGKYLGYVVDTFTLSYEMPTGDAFEEVRTEPAMQGKILIHYQRRIL